MNAAPPLVARTADLLSDFGPSWALCGGWAVDAWLGRVSREHCDVDLSVFRDDQRAVFEYFTTGWLLNGHDVHDDDGTDPWNGRTLEFPSHIHGYPDGYDANADDVDRRFNLDIQLNRRASDDWVFSTRVGLTLPIDRCVLTTRWGLPTLAPEVVLFYKAIGSSIRPHDEADFRALLPGLAPSSRTWLRDALVALRPEHAWLPALT